MEDGTNISTEMRAEIVMRLADIERAEDVRILFAVESGSRAWGFPSPDSDYDVRFVYVRREEDYLSLWPPRDVIERPIDGLLDMGGWDLGKALLLLVKPNPVLLEWLRSPIVYRANADAMARLTDLAERSAYRRASIYHYRHLGEGQYEREIASKAQVRLKRYFYSLRPALALRWLRLQPGVPVPMDLPTLRAGTDLPPDVAQSIDRLLAAKAATKELGEGERIPTIDALIESEFAAARANALPLDPVDPRLAREADDLFRVLVRGTV